jgi:WD40 repeat protein
MWRLRLPGMIACLTVASGPQLLAVSNNTNRSPDIGGPLPLEVRVYDLRTRQLTHRLELEDNSLHSLSFSPDAKRLLAVGIHGTHILTLDRRGPAVRVGGGSLAPAVFAPDGKGFFGAGAGDLGLYDAAGAGLLRPFRGHKAPVVALALTPDGKRLASAASGGDVRVWDVRTGELVREMRSPWPFAMAFAPGGELVASGGPPARAWDVSAGRELSTFCRGGSRQGRTEELALAPCPDGKRLITGGIDGRLRVWELHTGRLLRQLEAHKSPVVCLHFDAANGRVVSGGEDGVICVWDAAALLGR